MRGWRGAVLGRTLVLDDITHTVRLMERLHGLAIMDDLTGIYNRRHFIEVARRELERAIRYDKNLSLLLLDLDHFKRINDTYGHAAGDAVLFHVACVCRESIRSIDIAGRYGGEELVILLPETAAGDAFTMAERIRERIEALSIDVCGKRLSVSTSIGVASRAGMGNISLEELLQAADRAMYRAKNEGRNRTAADNVVERIT